MDFSKKLTFLRKKHGLSQEKLAEKLDVSRQSVFKWESGENVPSIDKIVKLSELFNVTLDSLLIDEKDIEEAHDVQPVETKKHSLSKNGLIAIICVSCALISVSGASIVILPKYFDSKNNVSNIDTIPFDETIITPISTISSETIDDNPNEEQTRGIILPELNGTWESKQFKWIIEDLSSYSAVVTYIYEKFEDKVYPFMGVSGRSTLSAYGVGIQRKVVQLANGTFYPCDVFSAYVYKNSDGLMFLCYSDQVFLKV